MIILERIGYRLNMSPDMPYQKACSIQLYKGIIAKIMVLFKLAISHQFLNDQGRLETYAINIKSLGDYIHRNNSAKYGPKAIYSVLINSFYKADNKILKENVKQCKDIMSFIIRQRKFIKSLPTSISAFKEIINHKAPFKGKIYKIEKDNQTKGYILGTIHIGNSLLFNLSPKINKALEKSNIVAFESYGSKVKISQEAMIAQNKSISARNDYCKISNLRRTDGVETQILFKTSKERAGLEDQDERWKLIKKRNEIKRLSKKTGFINFIENLKIFRPLYRIRLKKMIVRLYCNFLNNKLKCKSDNRLDDQRNLNMVNAAEEHFKKGRTFIAVGYAHLVEGKNMLELFKERGYTVTKYSRKNFKKAAAAP